MKASQRESQRGLISWTLAAGSSEFSENARPVAGLTVIAAQNHNSFAYISQVTVSPYADYRFVDSRITIAISEVPESHSPNDFAIVTLLLELNAHSRVSVDRANHLIFHSKRSDECFESTEFVQGARKLVKENKVSRL